MARERCVDANLDRDDGLPSVAMVRPCVDAGSAARDPTIAQRADKVHIWFFLSIIDNKDVSV